ILPANTAWGDDGAIGRTLAPVQPRMPSDATLDQAARLLRNGARTAILLGHHLVEGRSLVTAGRIAAATGAKLLAPFGFTRIQRGAGLPIVERVPYVIEQAVEQLREFQQIILVGAPAPVAFFAYPSKPGTLTPLVFDIPAPTESTEDGAGALEALASLLGAS